MAECLAPNDLENGESWTMEMEEGQAAWLCRVPKVRCLFLPRAWRRGNC